MIVTKLTGWLWNQMFQYAIGRAVSLHMQTSLVLDVSSFGSYTLHQYSLEKFCIIKNYATYWNLPWYERHSKNRYVDYFYQSVKNLLSLYNKSHIREKWLQPFRDDIFSFRGDLFLDWYFQSEKYFLKYADIIRSDFEVIIAPSLQNQWMMKQIQSVNSVSLHVRRGDYVANFRTNQTHWTCSMDYYKKAISYISKHVETPVFFVFSDDIQWAKKNIDTGYKQFFVDFNDASQNHEDIRLMANCKHNIIANSTFSWWGAWLNSNTSKIVVAPAQWFANTNFETSDICPESWFRL
jgi:hypothetical protein